jgi:hypothetical protein
MPLYPISYSFPDELFVESVPQKTAIFASHMPINVSNSGYIYNNCNEYMKVYQQSIFGITSKKCGWDCYRHLEILSQGACMYMLDIEHIPKYTMTHYPLPIIQQFMEKYGHYSLEFIQKHAYSSLYGDLNSVLNASKKTLTSSKMLEYILEKSNFQSASNILYSVAQRDYTLYSLQYAGKKRFGLNFIDHSVGSENNVDFLYKDYSVDLVPKLYGRGFNYTRLLESSLKSSYTDQEILEKVKAREFDCIIASKNNPLLSMYLQYYEPNEIIVICVNDCDPLCHPTAGWVTTDSHTCWFNPPKDIHVFRREIGNVI